MTGRDPDMPVPDIHRYSQACWCRQGEQRRRAPLHANSSTRLVSQPQGALALQIANRRQDSLPVELPQRAGDPGGTVNLAQSALLGIR